MDETSIDAWDGTGCTGRNARTERERIDGRTDGRLNGMHGMGRNSCDGVEYMGRGGTNVTGWNGLHGMGPGGIHGAGRNGIVDGGGAGRIFLGRDGIIMARDGMHDTGRTISERNKRYCTGPDGRWCRLRDDVGDGLLRVAGARRQRVLPAPAAAAEVRPAASGGTSNSGGWENGWVSARVDGWVPFFLF